MIKCNLCGKKAFMRKGYFNFSDVFIPLCKFHMEDYLEWRKVRETL
jgi:hypothetical protein